MKNDLGKPRMSLVMEGFSDALLEVGKVSTFGADKYGVNTWQNLPQGSERYTDALYRHLLSKDELDQESGLLHAAHVAWNALAILQLKLEHQD